MCGQLASLVSNVLRYGLQVRGQAQKVLAQWCDTKPVIARGRTAGRSGGPPRSRYSQPVSSGVASRHPSSRVWGGPSRRASSSAPDHLMNKVTTDVNLLQLPWRQPAASAKPLKTPSLHHHSTVDGQDLTMSSTITVISVAAPHVLLPTAPLGHSTRAPPSRPARPHCQKQSLKIAASRDTA